MELYRKFISFLIDNNCYNQYCNNIKQLRQISSEEWCIKKINSKRERNLIAYAFHWFKTNEGYSFWQNINEKWRQLISSE